MAFDGIGASVRRKEDGRFLRGRGNYVDDMNRPGQLHAVIKRADRPHAKINGIDTAAAAKAPGVVAVFTGADMAADGVGGLPCGWQIHNKDGSPMAEPAHPVLAVGKVRHVGDPVAVVIAETEAGGEGRSRTAGDRLPGPARGRDDAGCVEAGRGGGARRCRRQSVLRLAYRRQGPGGWRLRQGGEGGEARPHQQSPGAECHGTTRRDRRVRSVERRLHAVHYQPEPACHPPADGRFRAAHSREQAARRGAGCRRRVRLEDLPLCGRGNRHLGVRQAAPPGEVDRRAQRKLHVGRAWPRPRFHRRDGAGR